MTDDGEIKTSELDSQALERRQSGRSLRYERERDRSNEGNEPLVVAPDGVCPFVQKLVQRYCKDARPFSLASFDVLEFEQVLSTLGTGAADQLDRLCKAVCSTALRGSDRVCFFEPGHLLIVLPDTNRAAAKLVMERITQSVASARLQYKNKPLHASGVFAVSSCDTESGDADLLAPDVEALLSVIGYKIDANGALYNTELSSMRLFTKKQRHFAGSFSVWSDRYTNIEPLRKGDWSKSTGLPPGIVCITATAIDKWQANRPVVIKILELADRSAKFDLEILSQIARRARVLQQVDHPGLNKLMDFHSYEDRCLYLVENQMPGRPLTEIRTGVETVLDWGIQLCNSLIFLQNLVPPLIPPPLRLDDIFISLDSQLILTNYETSYLLAPLLPENRFGIENLLMLIYDMLSLSDQKSVVLSRFIASDDTGASASEKMNSVFKVRAELKAALEELGEVQTHA